MTPDEITEQKQIAFYESSVDAWYNTSLERDKSLLTMSAGGIGLLITLLTTVGLSSANALVLYAAAIISFIVTLISVLIIFDRNGRHIEEIICKSANDNALLGVLDKFAFWAFVAGVIFTAIIGITAATHSITLKEQIMTKETKGTPTIAQDSFRGVANLGPATAQNSFNGATALRPQPAANTESSPSSAPTAASAATSSGGENTQAQSGNEK